MNAARHASLIAFAQSRGFCPTGEGGGVDNSCGGSGKGSDYDPGHFDVGPDPNGLTEKDLMYSPTVKWTQDHKSLVRDAVKSWKGSPTDMTLHVMSELKGESIPGSGSGKIMRAQATALLTEVLDNAEPAPTLYRGASIPPEQDPSPLLGWTSKKSVAQAFAKKNNGEVYTLEGASGLNTSGIKAHGMGEAEWIVPHKIPDGYHAGNASVAKPAWMGEVDASGSTKHGTWFLERNAKQNESPWHGDVTTHVLSMTDDKGQVKAFAFADMSDDKSTLYMNYAQVGEPHRGQGVYKSILDSLSGQYRVVSDDQHNVAAAARKAYESLGARVDSYGHYVLEKKKKQEGRAFCATGEGNGIDNSCGAKTMSAPDKDGGGGSAKTAAVNNGVKPSSPLSPKNKKSWMAPSGDFYPVSSEQTHNAWAVANTNAGKLPEVEYDDAPAGEHLFKGGWLRIADTPDTFYMDTTSNREPSGVQKKNAIDFAIHSGNYDEVLLTNDGWIKKTLWRRSDDRAFCPNGTGGGVTNTCGKGIGVNDADQDFTGQILSGEKTIETRPTNSLKPYIGKTVGIVRTGKGKATLVGVMKVGEPKFYKTRKEFDADFDKHRVGKDSGHYIGPEGKYGYPLSEVKPVKPRVLKSTGYVARVIAKKVRTRELTVEFDLDAESPEEPNTESRSADCAREDDGRFASGNKCGGSVDMPKEDPRGRMRYDNGVQTDAARKLYQMGSSEKKLKGLVDAMGGDAKNTRVDINPPSLNISVADKDGNKLFHVDFENGRARLYPAKDLSPAEAKKIKEAAGEAFGGRQADTTIKVFSKASDMKKWDSENAAKIKKWEDKYAFSTLLPPHQRPKKWERSIDARYASLLAFAEARDCGQDKDGKFSKGNTCASGIAADAAKGATFGAVLGAASGFGKTFLPQVAATSAAYGAVAGAVKGIYDNQMKPTRVSDRIASLGLNDKGVAKIVKSLGGSSKSVASTTGRARLTLKIKDKEGKVTHVVDFTKKTVTIYPKKASKELTDSELQAVKAIAAENAPKQTKFAVKSDSLSYAKRIARNGFEVAANKAGLVIATAIVAGAAPSVPDAVLGTADLVFDTHFTDSLYRKPNAKR